MCVDQCLYVNKILNEICSSYKVNVSLQKTWIKLLHYNVFMNVLLLEYLVSEGTKMIRKY